MRKDMDSMPSRGAVDPRRCESEGGNVKHRMPHGTGVRVGSTWKKGKREEAGQCASRRVEAPV